MSLIVLKLLEAAKDHDGLEESTEGGPRTAAEPRTKNHSRLKKEGPSNPAIVHMNDSC